MKNKICEQNFSISFNQEDEKCIHDLILALDKGQKDIFEFLGIPFEPIGMNIFVYENVEKFHEDVYNSKKDDWNVCSIQANTIKIVSPLSSGRVHNYQDILLIANKAVQDIILNKYFHDIPKWLGLTTLTSGLMSDTKTNHPPRLSCFFNDNYYSDSDSYFIANFLINKFGKETMIKILEKPQNYREILGLSNEEIDYKLEEYYRAQK